LHQGHLGNVKKKNKPYWASLKCILHADDTRFLNKQFILMLNATLIFPSDQGRFAVIDIYATA
jgi:muramidase (phage lysozyme)